MSVHLAREVQDMWHPYVPESAPFADLETRVHVWRTRLDALDGRIGDNLSADETLRADKFHRAEDRRRFIAARGILRLILADLLDLPDQPKGGQLRFGYGPAGKPHLLDDPRLRFNVSHSEDMAVIAVTRAGEVGIDIERQRPLADMDAIARVAFNDAEKAALMGCPTDDRDTMFYRIWTRKEAHLKAMGVGLPALDNRDALSIAPGKGAWFQTTLPHLDGYVASLVRPRGAHGLRLWSGPNAVGMRSSERRAKLRPLLAVVNSVFPHRLESRS